MTELSQLPSSRCINLCSKALTVHGESFENDPDYQAGMDQVWCLATSKGLGPDGGDVGWEECRDAGRGCYQEF